MILKKKDKLEIQPFCCCIFFLFKNVFQNFSDKEYFVYFCVLQKNKKQKKTQHLQHLVKC